MHLAGKAVSGAAGGWPYPSYALWQYRVQGPVLAHRELEAQWAVRAKQRHVLPSALA